MLVLPTAKILLFIALNVGPQNAQTVYATSNSESYVWTTTKIGWSVEGKGFPASDFTRNPTRVQDFTGSPGTDSVPAYLRVISKYKWNDKSVMVFDNGNRIERHGDHAFYILNAGGPNEKVFTILFPKGDS
jgi:hypothetical protein